MEHSDLTELKYLTLSNDNHPDKTAIYKDGHQHTNSTDTMLKQTQIVRTNVAKHNLKNNPDPGSEDLWGARLKGGPHVTSPRMSATNDKQIEILQTPIKSGTDGAG